jgi:hypothetical protein
MGTVFTYAVLRWIFHEELNEDGKQVNKIRRNIVILNVLALFLSTILYLYDVGCWTPSALCTPPFPVFGFVAWIIWLVIDTLQTFNMLNPANLIEASEE